LLVVLGIIATLAGLLLPAMTRVREHSRSLSCISNLHQWGFAVLTYASSNDGYLPRRGQGVNPTTIIDRPDDWFNALPPLLHEPSFYAVVSSHARPPVSSVWRCPDSIDGGQTYFWSYAMNMWLSTQKGPPDRLDKVGPLSTMVFLSDGPPDHCSTLPSNKPYSPVPRHSGYVNICFLDGHVTSFASDYVGCGIGIPDVPDVRWKVPHSRWDGPP